MPSASLLVASRYEGIWLHAAGGASNNVTSVEPEFHRGTRHGRAFAGLYTSGSCRSMKPSG